MFDKIIDFIYDKFPVLFAIVVVAFVIWQVAKLYFVVIKGTSDKVDSHDKAITGLSERVEKVEERVGKVEVRLERVEVRLEKVEERLGRVEVRLDSHDDKLAQIIYILTKKYPKSTEQLAPKNSPRKLSDIGTRLYEESGARDVLEANMELFIDKLTRKNLTTALDVEEASYEVLLSNIELPLFKPLKDWVYNCPDWRLDTGEGMKPYSIEMYDVCFVMSIPLRDEYLSRHPDIIPMQS